MRSLVALFVATGLAVPGIAAAADQMPAAEIYKHPLCGCCGAYADLARQEGYGVTVVETEDLSPLKRQMGIPEEMESCHTMLVDGYVVEGHVPFSVVDRLLEERPDIKGIALPGMPSGSPGMNGAKIAPFTVYQLGEKSPAVYAIE